VTTIRKMAEKFPTLLTHGGFRTSEGDNGVWVDMQEFIVKYGIDHEFDESVRGDQPLAQMTMHNVKWKDLK
jgi:hypothetical protein